MTMELNKVYHQEYRDGTRIYARIVSQFANGRFKALTTNGRRKPVQASVDPTVPYWRETPIAEIPAKLR